MPMISPFSTTWLLPRTPVWWPLSWNFDFRLILSDCLHCLRRNIGILIQCYSQALYTMGLTMVYSPWGWRRIYYALYPHGVDNDVQPMGLTMHMLWSVPHGVDNGVQPMGLTMHICFALYPMGLTMLYNPWGWRRICYALYPHGVDNRIGLHPTYAGSKIDVYAIHTHLDGQTRTARSMATKP